jgi:hypothetical protein
MKMKKDNLSYNVTRAVHVVKIHAPVRGAAKRSEKFSGAIFLPTVYV